MIPEDLNPKKAPGYYQITQRILKEIPRKGIVNLTTTCNTFEQNLRKNYSQEITLYNRRNPNPPEPSDVGF
jgi:hypothetical protein